MGVVAVVPATVAERVDFTDVVPAIQRTAVVRDTVKLILGGSALTRVLCKSLNKVLAVNKIYLHECGAKALMSSVSGNLTVVLSFSRRIAEW